MNKSVKQIAIELNIPFEVTGTHPDGQEILSFDPKYYEVIRQAVLDREAASKRIPKSNPKVKKSLINKVRKALGEPCKLPETNR